MIYSVDTMRKDTVALITQIDRQIDEVTKVALDHNREPSQVTDEHGSFLLSPLLQAKAIAYNTLVMLQSGTNAPAGRGRERPPSRPR